MAEHRADSCPQSHFPTGTHVAVISWMTLVRRSELGELSVGNKFRLAVRSYFLRISSFWWYCYLNQQTPTQNADPITRLMFSHHSPCAMHEGDVYNKSAVIFGKSSSKFVLSDLWCQIQSFVIFRNRGTLHLGSGIGERCIWGFDLRSHMIQKPVERTLSPRELLKILVITYFS